MTSKGDPRIDYSQDYDHPDGETYTHRMRDANRLVTHAIIALILLYVVAALGGFIPTSNEPEHAAPEHGAVDSEHAADVTAAVEHAEELATEHVAENADEPASAAHGSKEHSFVPPFWAVLPFVFLLLAIAVLPLIGFTEHWWHHNRNRFIVAAGLGILTLLYYAFMHPGGIGNHFTHQHGVSPGWATAWAAFCNGIFYEFVPFIILLFCLYVISGGINLRGDLPARPMTNCAFIGVGTLLASFIGTTGAAMVLIRPLLATNAERKHKIHTVIFFIFMVCNCGGLLLPIGDPPLFLGYLRGVPFLWTLKLWPYWLALNLALLAIYFVWDSIKYRDEAIKDIARDETQVRPLELTGKINFLFLLGVVLCVALVVPDKAFLGTNWYPYQFFRETLMLVLVILSLNFTHAHIRVLNRFDYVAITEVAALFCGIFICMQVPIEILNIKGPDMGIDSPTKFFWATGVLSSFLDNAPTYVVFFETARSLPAEAGMTGVVDLVGAGHILEHLLVPISLGAVFMGANTYIGNGPNFMVKAIAEQSGIKMPSFFGYMLYSCVVLLPLFALLTLVRFVDIFGLF